MLDALATFSDVLQMLNYEMSVKDASNSEILSELQMQDRVFLKKIVSNQELMLKKLDEIKDLLTK